VQQDLVLHFNDLDAAVREKCPPPYEFLTRDTANPAI
jgi:hypothetical protein